MRTVDADQILTHLKPYESSDEGWYVTGSTVLRLIHKAIKNAPIIDAIPVIHAHQNEYQTPPMICCSNCDWGTDPQEKFFNYCPMCVAKMKRSSND